MSWLEMFKQAHRAADVDDHPAAMHHTLGLGPNQAAPGTHGHDGDYQPVGDYASGTHLHDSRYLKGRVGTLVYASELPSSFPQGTSVQYGSTGTGFPNELCTVVTHRVTGGRTIQTTYARDSGLMAWRAETATLDTWGPWRTDNLTPDTWHQIGSAGEPAFKNGWGASGSPSVPVNFTKNVNGSMVHITGQMNPLGASGSICFTLPVGYRPSPNRIAAYPVTSNTRNLSVLDIETNGDVTVYYNSGMTWVGLNVHFYVP